MRDIVLALPLRQIQVNQPFGVNYLNFYQQWGYKGHNGVDLLAMDGFSCYAAHTGIVTFAGPNMNDIKDGKPAIEVELMNVDEGYKTLYYHLKDINGSDGQPLKVGQKVSIGEIIGHCDNTGTYTTGDHLHFGLKLVDEYGETLNKDNGYGGAIDPTPYFQMTYNGVRIANTDCYKSNAYHRYYRGRPNGGWWIEKFRVVPALLKFLKRIPTNEEINACTYGG